MSEATLYRYLLWGLFLLSPIIFGWLLLVTAPYGRHTRSGFGPQVGARLAWILMEAPASLAFLGFFLVGERRGAAVPILFLLLWQSHYVDRAFVFPVRMRAKGKTTPFLIALSGLSFNVINAYLNARYLTHFGPERGLEWLKEPRFVLGLLLFGAGYVINRRADAALFALRKPGDTGYSIPRGGMYELVSCPNYLGELMEWTGFAIAAWSPAGAAFAVFTAANLVPRAISHHRWYRKTFPNYPAERKAIVPFLL
jgi:hypothetical protein